MRGISPVIDGFSSQRGGNLHRISLLWYQHSLLMCWTYDDFALNSEDCLHYLGFCIDGSVQDCDSSIANALKSLQSYIKPLITPHSENIHILKTYLLPQMNIQRLYYLISENKRAYANLKVMWFFGTHHLQIFRTPWHAAGFQVKLLIIVNNAT